MQEKNVLRNFKTYFPESFKLAVKQSNQSLSCQERESC